MLNIKIICVGKFKEKYWEAASAEYMKRLGAYCSVSVTEVKEEKLPAHASRADEENVIMKEGNIIQSGLTEEEIKKIKENNEDYINAIKLFREKFMKEYTKTLINSE